MKKLIIAILAMSLSGLAGAETPTKPTKSPVTVSNLSKAALTGLQLSVKKGVLDGKVTTETSACVAGLKASSFNSIYEPMVREIFTTEEEEEVEGFFKSDVGEKYAKYGLLQIYVSVGLPSPEEMPTLSERELNEVEKFSKTSGGEKLMIKHSFQTLEANSAVQTRIHELLTSCGHVDKV